MICESNSEATTPNKRCRSSMTKGITSLAPSPLETDSMSIEPTNPMIGVILLPTTTIRYVLFAVQDSTQDYN
jgi:hypothetical protein